MDTKQSVKKMRTGNGVKFRRLWDYLCNEPHVNNEEKWRLKCLKIPI